MRSRRRWFAYLVACVVAASACSGGRHQDPIEGQPLTLLEHLPSAEVVDDHLHDMRSDFLAGEEATQRCMQELGFDYRLAILKIDPIRDDESLAPLALHEYRARFGYGVSFENASALPLITIEETAPPIADEVELDAYNSALHDLDGCDQHQFHPEFSENFVGYTEFSDESYERIIASKAYTDALERWRSCFRSQGFDFDGDAIFDELNARFERVESEDDLRALQRFELATARADVECLHRHIVPVVRPYEIALLAGDIR